jgi:hypothetical protein
MSAAPAAIGAINAAKIPSHVWKSFSWWASHPASIAKLKGYASQTNETKNLKARPVCVVAITDDALNAQLPFGSKSGGQISKSGK